MSKKQFNLQEQRTATLLLHVGSRVFMYVIYRIVMHGLCVTESTKNQGTQRQMLSFDHIYLLRLRHLSLLRKGKILTEILEKSTPKPRKLSLEANRGDRRKAPAVTLTYRKMIKLFRFEDGERWKTASPPHRIVKQQFNNNKLV